MPLADVAPTAISHVDRASSRILYVQAPGFPRSSLAARLRAAGFEPVVAADAADALRRLGEDTCAACFVDLAGGRQALTTVRLIRARYPTDSLVGVIDAGSPTMAADATHAGVSELLTWPFDAADLAALVIDLQDRAPGTAGAEEADETIVAASVAMRDVLRQVRELAGTRQTLCLSGPEGSGRRLLATALHQASAESAGPIVLADCSGQSPSALESELFGARSGAAGGDGSAADRIDALSAVARARGGTLVLTHLDEAPSRVQMRLAALLRDREVLVGPGNDRSDVNVRVVATMAPGAIDAGATVRADLATRLVARLDVPALRRRREDIPLLATRYLATQGIAEDRQPPRFSRAALELLAALPWPGNVPELERVIDAIVSDTRRPVVQLEDVLRHVSLDGGPRVSGGGGLREAREQFERECIEAALVRSQGRVGEAARALGIQRTNLYRKVRQLGISRTLLSSQR